MSEPPRVMVLPRSVWVEELARDLERQGVPDAARIAKESVDRVIERIEGRRKPIERPDPDSILRPSWP